MCVGHIVGFGVLRGKTLFVHVGCLHNRHKAATSSKLNRNKRVESQNHSDSGLLMCLSIGIGACFSLIGTLRTIFIYIYTRCGSVWKKAAIICHCVSTVVQYLYLFSVSDITAATRKIWGLVECQKRRVNIYIVCYKLFGSEDGKSDILDPLQ